MKKKNMILNLNSDLIFILILILIIYSFEASSTHKSCKPSGHMTGKKTPPGQCNTENEAECCVAGKKYTTYTCSPHVSCKGTKAVLTINSFEEGGDGGGPSECDSKYHSDDKPVVALSTGWYKQGQMCNKTIIIINGINGWSVKARVVDECDSKVGCDHTHAYQPPCPHNIVDGSKAVWEALGLNTEDGEIDVTWMDRDACRS